MRIRKVTQQNKPAKASPKTQEYLFCKWIEARNNVAQGSNSNYEQRLLEALKEGQGE